jgi:hypothetical protein
MGCGGGAIVTFDYDAFIALYPEFTDVSPARAQQCFNQATLYWRNDGTGMCNNPVNQLMYLNMLTAHIASRYIQVQGDPNPGSSRDPNTPVGRVSNASEGSVSVAFENQYPPGSAQWFQQTRYGSDFWQATAAYRKFRYRRGPNWDPTRAGTFNP